jgi:hypothetical protein
VSRDYRHICGGELENQERRTSSSGDPLFEAALLRQAGLYCSGEKIFLATCETAMVIRKKHLKTKRKKSAEVVYQH